MTPKDESLSDLMKRLDADSASGLSSAEAEKLCERNHKKVFVCENKLN